MSVVTETVHDGRSAGTILYLDGVSVSFDGFKALNDLSLYLDKGEMRAIIGPNGAGKTTMMDVITGKTRPDKGTVLFREDIDLTRHDESDIARLGIGRKFQKPTVFESHTVWTNLELALNGERELFRSLFFDLAAAQRDRIGQVLRIVRLEDAARGLAGELSHGQKQWLEIGMLLVQDPELLLVDEPVAGMTDAETEATGELLREISRSHSVVVVEHDMEFVRGLGSKVTVLHEGSVLAEGSLEQVQNDQRVIEVYLGR
ncbi:MAG: urea ABC transporter ATP-binding protein UrtD [Geminicoccaceae bacterium]